MTPERASTVGVIVTYLKIKFVLLAVPVTLALFAACISGICGARW
jgi:hypothetical protein